LRPVPLPRSLARQAEAEGVDKVERRHGDSAAYLSPRHVSWLRVPMLAGPVPLEVDPPALAQVFGAAEAAKELMGQAQPLLAEASCEAQLVGLLLP
jgi:hypothetical protein